VIPSRLDDGTRSEVRKPQLISWQRSISQPKSFWKHPTAGPNFTAAPGRYLLRHFPSLVVYRVFDDRVQIVAYQHGSRRSGFWRNR
jgi:hypothetical protein